MCSEPRRCGCSRWSERWFTQWVAAWGVLLLACQSTSIRSEVVAEFGLFFGGQVQQLVEIPFELDVSKQRQGFRLQRKVASTSSQEVSWELSLARAGRKVADSHGRKGQLNVVRFGTSQWLAGEKRFEKELPFAIGEPLGMWNIRVVVDGQAVLDRPFTVYNRRTGRR